MSTMGTTNSNRKERSSTRNSVRGKKATTAPLVIDISTSQKDLASRITLLKQQYKQLPRTEAPIDVKPMLATTAREAFNDVDWLFEIKWDGYRALTYHLDGKTEIRSRNNLPFSKRYFPLVDALRDWQVDAVLDGELVVLNREGKADFNAMQQWHKTHKGKLVYYVFDILWLEGMNLMKLPLWERRKILKQVLPSNSIVRYSEDVEEIGIDFLEVARQNGLEGIIGKQKHSSYDIGARSKDWFKIKLEQRHEAVICGYTKNKGTSRLFSSLILGVPHNGKMEYIGQVGTGFNERTQQLLFKKMNPYFTTECPFNEVPSIGAATQWLQPHLVCEVKYTERTRDGVMRHPSFQGLRIDKTLAEFNAETVHGDRSSQEMPDEIGVPATAPGKAITFNKNVSGKPLVGKEEDTKVLRLNDQQIKLTNLQKIYWPKEKTTKSDLLNYYYEVLPYIMPYLQDRPQSLNRFPNGITGNSFYQKNMQGKVPGWIDTFKRQGESAEEPTFFLVCKDEASLMYMVNLGCIEINPWHSRVTSPQYPDWCVIDLDPGKIPFNKVIEAALMVKEVLDSMGITSWCKTSGSTGLHIYMPLRARYSYEQSRHFAELVARLVHQQLPKTTSLERSPAKRIHKIYIDYLQNRPIQTICAPYSVRPKKGATVSAPLHWSEVKRGLEIKQFTIKNMIERLHVEGDLFKGVLGEGIDLNFILKQLYESHTKKV